LRGYVVVVAVSVAVLLQVGCSISAPEAHSSSGVDSGETEDASRIDGAPVDAGGPTNDGPPTATDSSMDAAHDGAGGDAADAGNGCFDTTYGVYGSCMTTASCAALGDHTSVSGFCPGPSGVECCIDTPDVSDNPPVPMGWVLMQQSMVTAAMTNWAVMILDDPVTYPMWSTTMQTFGTQLVMARVEWHPPDFQNNTVHRGVTLYVPG
jgi:hypothetical protein